MILSKYIEEMGVDKMAATYGVTAAAVRCWRDLKYPPDPPKANEIVKGSKGLVTFEEIYTPFFEALAAVQNDERNA